MSTRREFIKQIGIRLASMIMARCQVGNARQPAPSPIPSPEPSPIVSPSPEPSPNVSPSPTPEPAKFEASGDSPRARLRSCWQALEWLTSPEGGDCSRETQGQLESEHQAALSEMIAAGQIGQEVAAEVQAAFRAAADHSWASACMVVCYEPAPLPYAASSQLVNKAELLDRMGKSQKLDAETVAEARQALERDIAFLGLDPDQWPQGVSFAEIELEIAPEVAQAARFLAELLSADKDG